MWFGLCTRGLHNKAAPLRSAAGNGGRTELRLPRRGGDRLERRYGHGRGPEISYAGRFQPSQSMTACPAAQWNARG